MILSVKNVPNKILIGAVKIKEAKKHDYWCSKRNQKQ